MKLAKWASVMESAPTRSPEEAVSFRLEFAGLLAFEVVDFVAVAIDQHGAGGAHDGRAAVAVVDTHALAAVAFPGEHLVVVFEAGDQGVVELPVIFEVVAAAGGGNAVGIVDAERPAADVDFMRAVVERFAGAPDPEPVPVIGLDVVLVGLARRGALPEIPIELGGTRARLCRSRSICACWCTRPWRNRRGR